MVLRLRDCGWTRPARGNDNFAASDAYRESYKTTKGDEVLFDSTYTVNTSTNPKQINMVETEGDLTGKEAQGIYALDGDVLRICYRMPGLGRPDAFESPAGSMSYLVTWKRQSRK